MENNNSSGRRFKNESPTSKKGGKKGKQNKTLNILLVVFIAIFVISGGIFVYYNWIADTLDKNGINALLGQAGVGFAGDDESENSLDDSSDGLDSDTSEYKVVSVDDVNINSLSFLTMTFSTLKNTNKNIKGWFYFAGPASIKGLPISTPLLQGADNEAYLSLDYNDRQNENGSVFANYTADMSDIFSNQNLILYGHARSYQKFGGLKYLNEAKRWYLDANNHFIYITTEHEKTIWQVFSWYETTADADYRKSTFQSDEELLAYCNELQSRNEISTLKKFDFTQGYKNIITLSTCKTLEKSKRVAVHAKLVRYEKY